MPGSLRAKAMIPAMRPEFAEGETTGEKRSRDPRSLSSAAFPRAPRWRSNAMCWGDAVGLDVGANTSTIAVSSPCAQSRAGPGRVLGWPTRVAHGCSRSSGPIARPFYGPSGSCGRGCARSHMRDLGRYAAAFQIAGFGPCLVRRRPLLLFLVHAADIN